MTINGNLPNESNDLLSTTGYFNNFYQSSSSTSPMVNDAVIAYFQSITGDYETGKNLASAVIYTALQQNLNPMEVIEQLKTLSKKNAKSIPVSYSGKTNSSAQDTDVYNEETNTWESSGKQYATPGPSKPYSELGELDAYLTMLLNLNRVGTSLLGINNTPQVSPYIQRVILP